MAFVQVDYRKEAWRRLSSIDCLRNIPMAHKREDVPDRYPGPSFYDEAHAWLLDSRRDGESYNPTFAQRILEQLRDIGLLHTTDAEPPANVRKVRLSKGDKVQDLWLRFDTIRDPRGYLTVEVVGPPRSDAAILAAMVARATEPIDFDQLLLAMAAERSWEETWQSIQDRGNVEGGEVLRVLRSRTDAYEEELKEALEGEGAVADEWERVVDSFLGHKAKEYGRAGVQLSLILHLVRYYWPEFDEYSVREKLDLIEKAHRYAHDFLEALRKLQAFLDYGTPDRRKLRPVIENPEQDVQAAILADVENLTFPQIGRTLSIPEPRNYGIDRDHQTVSDAVKRGRDILEEAFGKEGWQKQVEIMKAEKSRWWSLSPEERARERYIDMSALYLGISIEEARRRAEDRRP